jgi:hypothetical protein
MDSEGLGAEVAITLFLARKQLAANGNDQLVASVITFLFHDGSDSLRIQS